MNLRPFVCSVLVAAALLPPLTVTGAEFTVPPVEEINRQDMFERTPLMQAVRRGHADEVRALLAAGANPNIPEWHNNTPLMHACQHGYTDIVRAKQFEAARYIRNYALAVAMDLGAPEDHPDWAHSPYKAEVGRRLALLALAREYGVYEEDQVSSPAPAKAELAQDGKTITITFEKTVNGLTAGALSPAESIGSPVAGFSCGPYETRIPASATITSANTVTVQVPDGADASQVGYAFFVTVTPENANLANSISLPCPAFLLPVLKAEV